MRKSEQFVMVMTPGDKAALYMLAEKDRCSAASVVRRLVCQEAERRGVSQEAQKGEGQEEPNDGQ